MNRPGTGSLVIKEANGDNPRVLKDFILLPYRLYQDNPYWVAPLLSEEKRFLSQTHNPFLKRNPVIYYVCYRGKIPVGRIAGIINNEHNKVQNEQTAFFGFFESIQDSEVARLLFQAASQWAKARGAEVLRGPTNFTLNDVSGLLIEGFAEPPFIMMPYNPSYYETLYRENGFDIVMRFFAYDVTDTTIQFPAYLNRLEERLSVNDIQIRNFDFKYFERD